MVLPVVRRQEDHIRLGIWFYGPGHARFGQDTCIVDLEDDRALKFGFLKATLPSRSK
jgi:hypothetical protein